MPYEVLDEFLVGVSVFSSSFFPCGRQSILHIAEGKNPFLWAVDITYLMSVSDMRRSSQKAPCVCQVYCRIKN